MFLMSKVQMALWSLNALSLPTLYWMSTQINQFRRILLYLAIMMNVIIIFFYPFSSEASHILPSTLQVTSPAKADVYNSIHAIEDPLFLIKQREEAARQSLLSYTMWLIQLQQLKMKSLNKESPDEDIDWKLVKKLAKLKKHSPEFIDQLLFKKLRKLKNINIKEILEEAESESECDEETEAKSVSKRLDKEEDYKRLIIEREYRRSTSSSHCRRRRSRSPYQKKRVSPGTACPSPPRKEKCFQSRPERAHPGHKDRHGDLESRQNKNDRVNKEKGYNIFYCTLQTYVYVIFSIFFCISLVTLYICKDKQKAKDRAFFTAFFTFGLLIVILFGPNLAIVFFFGALKLLDVWMYFFGFDSEGTLKNVIQSLKKTGGLISLTVFFSFLMVYLFSVVGFLLFEDDSQPKDGFFSSLGQFFIFSLHQGIRAGGGIGDVLGEIRKEKPIYVYRVMYDMLHFLNLFVIMLNIISGLITDRFAELRAEKDEKAKILKNSCFIYGLERSSFDNKSVTFKYHIHNQHNMWHYLFFLIHIKTKDPTQFTGPESYVAGMIQKKNLNWFPRLRTLSLDGSEASKKKKLRSIQI